MNSWRPDPINPPNSGQHLCLIKTVMQGVPQNDFHISIVFTLGFMLGGTQQFWKVFDYDRWLYFTGGDRSTLMTSTQFWLWQELPLVSPCQSHTCGSSHVSPGHVIWDTWPVPGSGSILVKMCSLLEYISGNISLTWYWEISMLTADRVQLIKDILFYWLIKSRAFQLSVSKTGCPK